MIWIQHDFYSNFINSVGSSDTELSISIFVSEITDLIVYDSTKLFDLFKKSDIKISKKASDEELVDKILEQIQTNDKLVKGLAYLMAESNDTIKQNKGENWVVIINKISAGIRKIAFEIKQRPQMKGSIKKDIMAMDALKVSTSGDRSGIDGSNTVRPVYKKDNTVLYLVIGVAAAFGAYYLYKYIKERNAAKLLANGGVVVPDSSAVVPTTTVPVTPATNAVPVAPVVATPLAMPAADTYIAPAPVAPIVQPAVAQPIVNPINNTVPHA